MGGCYCQHLAGCVSQLLAASQALRRSGALQVCAAVELPGNYGPAHTQRVLRGVSGDIWPMETEVILR